ncbi:MULTISPECIES: energy transducer TonB [unclassified Phenylobacterium]|uniref:energy transducer TonB family protein n=1 Tax=unclassified Phenylobacterium TaxID=2640670 RepID=UPI00083A284F|nr:MULTISPECIES: energy transducer TonB [unclassified Phenylobacterium]
MQKAVSLFGGIVLSVALAGAASAASFQESMSKCLMKNANTRDAATVMLQCTAAGGKLDGCTVLSDSAPGKGFDKAALCVAQAMPMGDKSGDVKIPMRFPGGA